VHTHCRTPVHELVKNFVVLFIGWRRLSKIVLAYHPLRPVRGKSAFQKHLSRIQNFIEAMKAPPTAELCAVLLYSEPIIWPFTDWIGTLNVCTSSSFDLLWFVCWNVITSSSHCGTECITLQALFAVSYRRVASARLPDRPRTDRVLLWFVLYCLRVPGTGRLRRERTHASTCRF